MTHASVIAAAGAAALLALGVQGAHATDVASGQAVGKRIHKPAVAAPKPASKSRAASGLATGRRMHQSLLAKPPK